MAGKGKLFSADYQPDRKPRGKGWRTKILEALQEQGKTEEDFIRYVLTRAFNPDDPLSGKLLELVINRLSPMQKAVMPTYGFKWEDGLTPVQKVDRIIEAVANEELPADVANMLVSMIKDGLVILETTELVQRLEALERLLAEKTVV